MYALLVRTQDFREGNNLRTHSETRAAKGIPLFRGHPLPPGKCQLIFLGGIWRFGQTHRKNVTPSLDLSQLYLKGVWNYLSKFMQ